MMMKSRRSMVVLALVAALCVSALSLRPIVPGKR